MTTQLELARRRFAHLDDAVALLRLRQPRSRAIGTWTYRSSTGTVRRAFCSFCARLVATCSAKWPATRSFHYDADAHGAACATLYLERHGHKSVTLRMVLDRTTVRGGLRATELPADPVCEPSVEGHIVFSRSFREGGDA